jgi:transcriptional regulator with XRE-family HTH domain
MVYAGRPLKPLDPNASAAAKLGAELRARRLDCGLTLAALGSQIGYSPQHVSEVERANVSFSGSFVVACDDALEAGGHLKALYSAVAQEQAALRHLRANARAGLSPALLFQEEVLRIVGEDVDPTNRRGLLGAGAAAAALGGLGAIAAPSAARAIDPELPAHWTTLLAVLGHHDDANGPHAVLDTVRRELRVIAEHRAVARGELRTALMRVEARWTVFAAWLANDTGDARGREVLIERSLRLAREADYADVLALARARRAQWSDAPRALSHAQAGLRTHHASPQTRAWCASRVAHAYARLGDADATERMLDEVVSLVSQKSPPPPWSRGLVIEQRHVGAWEARCWLALKPAKAIPLFEGLLRDWPRARMRDGGLQQARLALACAAAGEQDRARVEGRKAMAIARATKSSVAARELKQLGAVLA